MMITREQREIKAKALNTAIEALDRSIDRKLTLLFTGYNLTSRVVEKHAQHYATFTSDEIPILAIDDRFADDTNRYGWSGVFITNQVLYYKVVCGTSLFGMLPRFTSGLMLLDQITSLAIGEEHRDDKGNYLGHHLVINEGSVGLLRIGGGDHESDQEVVGYLNGLFAALS